MTVSSVRKTDRPSKIITVTYDSIRYEARWQNLVDRSILSGTVRPWLRGMYLTVIVFSFDNIPNSNKS